LSNLSIERLLNNGGLLEHDPIALFERAASDAVARAVKATPDQLEAPTRCRE